MPVKRRELLAMLVAGTAGLAGCSGIATQGVESTTPTPSPATPSSLARHGSPSDICQRGFVDIGIYAIDEPAFAENWSGIEVPDAYVTDEPLADDTVVIGLTQGTSARAYPLPVLWHHEIVNDSFGDPLIVTYCSLCRSGMVAKRVIDGTATKFGVSGQLWVPPELETRIAEADGEVFAVERKDATPGSVRNSGNLVMYDQLTGSFWSQMLAEGICGTYAGHELEIQPSTATTWDEWRTSHPQTDVLLPPPDSTLIRSFP